MSFMEVFCASMLYKTASDMSFPANGIGSLLFPELFLLYQQW